MALIFKCAMCKRNVPESEELWLGEMVIHRNCHQNFDNRYGADIQRLWPITPEQAAAGGGYDPRQPDF